MTYENVTIVLLVITTILSAVAASCAILLLLQRRVDKKSHQEIPIVIPQTVECPEPEDVKNENQNLIEEWVEGMRNTFGERWDGCFSKVPFPLDEKGQAEMSLLLWNIASCTMDFVKSGEDDLPDRYKDNVALIAGKKELSELKEKEFYRDPTTVPKRVIAVRDWLRRNGVDETMVSAFGYRVIVSKKDDD